MIRCHLTLEKIDIIIHLLIALNQEQGKAQGSHTWKS